jgi:lipid A biosynthesis acyltransferase
MRAGPVSTPANLALSAALGACHWFSWPIAALRHGLPREAAAFQWLDRRPGGAACAIRHIAFTRLARQVLKQFLVVGEEATVLRRVHCLGRERLPRGGCILAIAHTPWGRVLARWSLSCDFAFILAHRRWAHWTGALHLLPTPAGLRRAVQELRRGRRVVVVIDDFVPSGGCAVEFLGRPARVTMRAARLAALAGVPVVPVTLRYRHGLICLEFGTPLSSNCGRCAREQMTRALCAGMERRVTRFPEEWNDLFEYFAGKTKLGVSTKVETSPVGRGSTRDPSLG